MICEQTRIRIKLSVAAYAYEYLSTEIMSDHEFDQLTLTVDLSISTSNAELDKYFRKYFNPSTGMWIRNHPNIQGLHNLYERYYKIKETT